MCDTGHHHPDGFGFLVDVPEVRELIAEAHRVTEGFSSNADRVDALRPAFQKLLSSEGWLPKECAGPNETSRMGGGIGQYALYRALLSRFEPERKLFLPVPYSVYVSILEEPIARPVMEDLTIACLAFDPQQEAIVKWKP